MSEAWGAKGASTPQCGKLFCLACLHARTHTAELTGRAALKIPRSVRLSVRPPSPHLFMFLMFLDLLAKFLKTFIKQQHHNRTNTTNTHKKNVGRGTDRRTDRGI